MLSHFAKNTLQKLDQEGKVKNSAGRELQFPSLPDEKRERPVSHSGTGSKSNRPLLFQSSTVR